MRAAMKERVLAALADSDPALKSATDARWKFLIKKVRVFLDGEDVTARCKAFSIPGRTVELYAEDERGKKVLAASCACGSMTRKEKEAARNFNPECRTCGRAYEWTALVVTRMGRVEVVPVSSDGGEAHEGAA